MHQQAIDALKAAAAHLEADAASGGGKLGGILKILWPILQQILSGLLGGGNNPPPAPTP